MGTHMLDFMMEEGIETSKAHPNNICLGQSCFL